MDIEEEERRTKLYDRNIFFETNELPRKDYLKRLTSNERKNLLNIVDIFKNKLMRERIFFPYALLAVGTATYPEGKSLELENQLLAKGFTRDSIVKEKSISYFPEYKTYQEYLDNQDDKLGAIVSEEKFNSIKEYRQEHFEEKLTLGELLDRSGKDLDFVFCNDCLLTDHLEILNYDKFENLKKLFMETIEKEGYNIVPETTYLDGGDIWINPERRLERTKPISSKGNLYTFRISPKTGRNLHFYFKNQDALAKIRREKILGLPFSQLIRRRDNDDLRLAIENGEKRGVFESDFYLKLELDK